MKSAMKSVSDQGHAPAAARPKAATFVNHGPEAIAQREVANAVHNSPQMVTQREVAESIHQSPQVAGLRALSSSAINAHQPVQRAFHNLTDTRNADKVPANITDSTSGPNASIAEGEMVGFGIGVDGTADTWKTEVKWGPLNGSNPKAGTWMEASPLGPDHPQGSEPGGTAPENWKAAMGTHSPFYVQGHLLNDNLGGTGTDVRNLTPITHAANDKHSRLVETPIRHEVNELKRWVYYKIEVKYPTTPPSTSVVGGPFSAYEAGIAKELVTTWHNLDMSGDPIGTVHNETILNVPPYPSDKSKTPGISDKKVALTDADAASSPGDYQPLLSSKHNKKNPVSDEFPNEAELVMREIDQWDTDVENVFAYITTKTPILTKGKNNNFKDRAKKFGEHKPLYKKKKTENRPLIAQLRLTAVRTAVHDWRRGLIDDMKADLGMTVDPNVGIQVQIKQDNDDPMVLDTDTSAAIRVIVNWNVATPFPT